MTDAEILQTNPYVNPETGICTARYERTVRVASYQIGAAGTIRLSAILRMEQETGEKHLDALGLGFEWLMREKKAFLITTNQIEVNRLPERNDELTIVSRPRGSAGIQFYRDFSFRKGEEELLRILQVSVMVDFETHKPLRPKEFYAYGIFNPMEMPKEDCPPRLRPGELPKLGERPIRYSDLDRNGHLTNTLYGDIVEDFVPETYRHYRRVQLNYVNESLLGDTLELYGGEAGGGFILHGKNQKGTGFTAQVL